ncbi:hypothetical protein PoB_000235200 [Plakobranchus ocellatus]|uniref:Uncharacterized protein n=1 Tax=Plakobranchus ocellatus TaxID=259542 RepID=A0AAV3Y161_9GAST|nr:hypothetical protein PoB_000235200 [Plakobranchus ocellatus]
MPYAENNENPTPGSPTLKQARDPFYILQLKKKQQSSAPTDTKEGKLHQTKILQLEMPITLAARSHESPVSVVRVITNSVA